MKRSRRHALGQHFLASPAVLERIVRVIDPRADDLVVEVGAGRGALTFRLAEKAGRVVAIEKDERLLPGLREAVPGNVEVVAADVLRADFEDLVPPPHRGRAKLVGNLPYAISSPLLFKVLAARRLFAAAVFLIQKEVARRVCAGPGTKDYAPLSILLQSAFEARLEFTVAPGSFVPPPKVNSALISLRRRPAPLLEVADEAGFAAFLRRAFGQRRKKLRNTLASYGAQEVAAAAEALGIPENARAEEVPMETLASLFRELV
jgi:16S rRNA (adenine1518-N6/adenine1519-N6)-dimethyltransferase